MTAKLKVAVVEPVGGYGGMAPYDLGLCDGLANAGCDVTLYTCEYSSPQSTLFVTKEYFTGAYGKRPAWFRGLCFVTASLRMIMDALTNHIQVFHFHLFQSGIHELIPLTLARILGRRVVITAHDVEPLEGGLTTALAVRWSLKMGHIIIAHNASSRDALVNSFPELKHRIRVIPHGNYLHTLPPRIEMDDARIALKLPKDQPVLLFFGQIKESKGLEVLIQAMPQILDSQPDTLLLIAGRPWKNNFSPYMKLIGDNGIKASCHLHIRYIPEEELALFYAAASLLILPYHKIYQSGVLLMSMSFGVPILASNLGGMTDVLGDEEKYGITFNCGDIDDLARQTLKCLNDLERSKQQAIAAYAMIQRNYNWQNIGEQTKSLYESKI